MCHRLVTLRRPGAEGIPFGMMRVDPAGFVTKRFPLPHLLLPRHGNACPLWAVYKAFQTPGVLERQLVEFPNGSRFLMLARAVEKENRVARVPMVEVLTKSWRTVLLAGGTFIATNGIAYVFMVYVLSYGTTELGHSRGTMLALLIAPIQLGCEVDADDDLSGGAGGRGCRGRAGATRSSPARAGRGRASLRRRMSLNLRSPHSPVARLAHKPRSTCPTRSAP